MTTALVHTLILPQAGASCPVSCPVATVEVETDIAAVVGRWRQLERQGVSTPYQSLAWFTAWTQSVSPSRGETPLIIIASDEQGRPTLLLPLVVRSRLGLRVASFAGSKHTNFNMPLMRSDVVLTPAAVEHLLARAARLRRVDVFLFDALPLAWEGISNPLVSKASRPHTASASCLVLSDSATALQSRKLRSRDRKLAEHGPLVITHARSVSEVERALEAFAAHKRAWFKARGISNPFEERGVHGFFAGLAMNPQSGVEISCLCIGDTVAAVAGTIVGRSRMSLMFVSYDAGSPIAAHSPGARLIRELIVDARRRGLEVFDFGLGEASYKAQLGAQVEPSAVLIRAATLRGWFGARVFDGQRRVKITLKRHPRLLSALLRLKLFVTRGRAGR